MIKNKIKYFTPPVLIDFFKLIKKKTYIKKVLENPKKQFLTLYNDPEMARILDEWGERHAWLEIQSFLFDKKNNKILDIACGTGIVIKKLNDNLKVKNVYGCDISEFLIKKAQEKGISKNFLKVCDATNLPYSDNEFDYCYSIGSLEHFTLEGINNFLISSQRVTKKISFHMIPVSKSNLDEGWIENYQSYFNNSLDWWLSICQKHFNNIEVIDSGWEDEISTGKWLILSK